jgi:hypothetical protein
VPRWSLHLAILALIGCGSDDPPAAGLTRDLRTALNTPPAAVDTAKQRADSQFQKCAYVFEYEAKLRECLVFIQGRAPRDAERAIAVYKGELRRIAESIQRAELAVYRTRARREDSLRAIARGERIACE